MKRNVIRKKKGIILENLDSKSKKEKKPKIVLKRKNSEENDKFSEFLSSTIKFNSKIILKNTVLLNDLIDNEDTISFEDLKKNKKIKLKLKPKIDDKNSDSQSIARKNLLGTTTIIENENLKKTKILNYNGCSEETDNSTEN